MMTTDQAEDHASDKVDHRRCYRCDELCTSSDVEIVNTEQSDYDCQSIDDYCEDCGQHDEYLNMTANNTIPGSVLSSNLLPYLANFYWSYRWQAVCIVIRWIIVSIIYYNETDRDPGLSLSLTRVFTAQDCYATRLNRSRQSQHRPTWEL